MIKIRDLSFAYTKGKSNDLALDCISLDVAQGEAVAITGQSGSGKSTLLGILGGMLHPSSGSYQFNAVAVERLGQKALAEFRGREIGFVFQNFVLLPHLSILENMLVPLEHLKSDKTATLARARMLLDKVGIASLEHRFPAQVSGGQAQRAAIARALMRNPPLILADEPTGSLDEKNATNILDLLTSLSNEGTTVIVVTHSAKVAQGLKRTVQISNGRIIEAQSIS